MVQKRMIGLAEYLFKTGKINKAEIIYKQMINIDANQILKEKAKFMLIEIEFERAKYKKAQKKYLKYIKETPFGEFTHKAYRRIREIDRR